MCFFYRSRLTDMYLKYEHATLTNTLLYTKVFFYKQIILPSARIIKKMLTIIFWSGAFFRRIDTNRRRFSNVSALQTIVN